MKTAVLMTVYQGDDPKHFHDAAYSIFVDQSLRADLFVIVVDGPICCDLDLEINKFSEAYHGCYVVRLNENVGLSNALNKGISLMPSDVVYIVRADADDISLNRRIERQVEYMEKNPEVAIASGQVEIFSNKPSNVIGNRCLPLGDGLLGYIKVRTPLNHSCSIIRHSALNHVSYPDTRLPFEDWWICLRFVKNGWRIGVVDEILMSFRGGDDMLTRRHGWSYLKKEFSFFKQIKKEGLMGDKCILRNLLIRSSVRLAPKMLIIKIYRRSLHGRKAY
jgi:glycosyltransferase involved in cell wall biosynthesis